MRLRVLTAAARRPWAAIFAFVAVAILAWMLLSRSVGHHVKVAFEEALVVPNGALVQASGVTVGKVTSITYEDGQAILVLGVNDDVWPLPRGTTARIRPASVAGNVNRRIELELGPQDAPAVKEGAAIGAQSPNPVEVDEVLQAFGPRARHNLRGALGNMARALRGHERDLNAGLRELPGTMQAFGGLMSDLRANGRQLSSLLRNGDRVTAVFANRRQRVAEIVDLASATFATFGERSANLQRTLDALPPVLTQVATTTERVTPTLERTTAVLKDLAPGAARLAPLAAVATPTLRELNAVGASGAKLARSATASAPDITKLLTRGTPFVRRLTPVVKQLTPILHCLGPYAPELAGTLSNWASWNANYDATSHVAKIFVDGSAGQFLDSPNIKSTDFKKLGVGYAMLRPPGYIGGRPRFMPECGLTPDGLNPISDWDDR